MSSNAGIQELMQAETRASQIVAEARVGRGDRLKQAKQEVRRNPTHACGPLSPPPYSNSSHRFAPLLAFAPRQPTLTLHRRIRSLLSSGPRRRLSSTLSSSPSAAATLRVPPPSSLRPSARCTSRSSSSSRTAPRPSRSSSPSAARST